MTTWILLDIAGFLMVAFVTGVIIPQILLIAFRKQLFDEIDPRKVHQGAVPRLGGIAFFPAILFALFMEFGCCLQIEGGIMSHMLQSSVASLCFICSATLILYLVGMADDLVGFKYRAKFIAQIMAAALVIAGGVTMDNLHGFLWIHELPVWIAMLLTALLTVFITNAINLIDGIDGLASGLSGIACIFYGYAFYQAGLYIYSILAFATLGALVPFFYYNVFGNVKKHSKIFMGDTGALTIGLILSVLSIRICRVSGDVAGMNPGVVAFAPLLIPCCDVVRVYLHRIINHRNPFMPDKSHIHHKFLALGLSQRLTMPAIVGMSFVLTVLNYWLSLYINITLLFVLDLAVWICGNMVLTSLIRKRERATGTNLYV